MPTGSDATGEQDHYAVLDVPRDADAATVARAYRTAVRRSHPDTGGSAEDFDAVQRAWTVLGDLAERARYDAALAGDWGVAGWGVSPDDAAPTSRAGEQDASGADLDPFEPGALPLPPFDLGDARRPRRVLPNVTDRSLVLTAATSAGVVVVTAAVAGPRISGAAYVVLVALSFFTGFGILVGRVFGSEGVVPWVGVAVLMSGAMLAVAVDEGLGSDDVVLLTSAALGCAAVAVLLGRHHRLGRPSVGRPADRAGGRIERYRLAGEWNRVRDALLVPGTHLERVVAPAELEGPGRWLLSEPRTGRTAVRALGEDARLGSWLVLDERGEVTAVAPSTALKAWRRVVAGGRRG